MPHNDLQKLYSLHPTVLCRTSRLPRWIAVLALIALNGASISAGAVGQAEYLPPEQAFVWSFRILQSEVTNPMSRPSVESALNPPDINPTLKLSGNPPVNNQVRTPASAPASAVEVGRLVVTYKIAEGYYLYRDQFQFRIEPANAAYGLKVSVWPQAQSKFDTTFGKTVAYYRGTVSLPLEYALQPGAQSAVLVVRSQGCADAGLCYPPVEHRVTLNSALGKGDHQNAMPVFMPSWRQSAADTALAATNSKRASGFGSQVATESSSALGVVDMARAGLTNDMQIARQVASMSTGIVVLVFLGLGMLLSLTPCALPMVPIVLGILSSGQRQSGASRWQGLRLSVCYVLGMAVIYTLLGVIAGALGQGLAVFLQQPWIVGVFAALLCLLALPMFGIGSLQLSSHWQTQLTVWSQRLPGGRATAAAGMGALSGLIVGPCVAPPLAGVLLFIAQTGDWLRGGAALFALAVGMGVPLLALGAGSSAFNVQRLARAGWLTGVKRVWGVLLVATAVWLIWPYLPEPLHQLEKRPTQNSVGSNKTYDFVRIDSVAALNDALARTQQPVMLDFYADWCVTCHEMDRKTFSHTTVQPLMNQFLRLQVDVTANTAAHQALLKRFQLFGPPGIVFFDAQGQLIPTARVVGFEPPDRFAPLLQSLLLATTGQSLHDRNKP